MGTIIDWLIDDHQKDLFEFLVALVLNIFFLILSGLLLWPLERLLLVFGLAKGYGLLWVVIFVTTGLLKGIQRFFRLNMYERVNAYVFSTLAVSCFLQVGWAAFAALTVHSFVTDAAIWIGMIVYLVGGLSCLTAFFVVGAIYQGTIYKLVSLPVILVSFLIFSVWPGSSWVLYGWFFQLF
jgi:hypothetical protein